MTAPLDKEAVLASLTPDMVLSRYSIEGAWRGRWLRSRRCAQNDHGSEAFAISADGKWHCHGCDKGGDLLALIAAGEKLDIRQDFPAVLAIGALVSGFTPDDPWDPRPLPVQRPAPPPLPPFEDRLALAKKRAAWVWGRLSDSLELARVRRDGRDMSPGQLYLESRGIKPSASWHEDIKESPLRCTPQEAMRSSDMKTLAYTFSVPGIAIPVRHVFTGEMVDVRIRRLEPRPDQPKVIGMLGGLTSAPAENGRPRQLVGCYGRPTDMARPTAVLVEGLADYLTALNVWPDAWVLGAVEAGTMGLLAAFAAQRLAREFPNGPIRLIIVEQADPETLQRDGTKRIGAADASINEDPNSAAKVAFRILGPQRVGWVFCGTNTKDTHDGKPTKDLNDLVRAGFDPRTMARWWSEGEHPASASHG